MKWIFISFILAAILFEAVADILFKYWTINAKGVFLWSGVLLYAIGTTIWAYSLKFEYLSKAISVFTILNLIVVILVGVILFKEDISSINKIGMMLGIISVILMQL